MSIYPIIIAPDKRLNQISRSVDKVDTSIKKIVQDMIDSMREVQGAGLAAIQIGIPKRILILDLVSYIPEETELRILINPEITFFSEDTWKTEEGCLSVPVKRVAVERPENITLDYLDIDGKKRTLQADNWLARGIQHEMDHLNGITLLNHIDSKLQLEMCIRKLNKYKKTHNTK